MTKNEIILFLAVASFELMTLDELLDRFKKEEVTLFKMIIKVIIQNRLNNIGH